MERTINIEDLHRGSIISYNGNWEKVQDIVGNSVTFQGKTYKEVPVEKCEAILLTGDIILDTNGWRRGFANSYRGRDTPYEAVKYDFNPDYTYIAEKPIGDAKNASDIRYVHLWQRFHRSVTGKELEIVMPV